MPAVEVILQRLPATLELALVGLVFSILIGIPLGVLAGLKPESLLGRSIMSGSILGFSLPNFWIGLMLILLFAVELRLLPASGRGADDDVLGVPVGDLHARRAEAPHPAGASRSRSTNRPSSSASPRPARAR